MAEARQRIVLGIAAIAVAIGLSSALATPVAEAREVSESKARAEAADFAEKVARRDERSSIEWCDRLSRNIFKCRAKLKSDDFTCYFDMAVGSVNGGPVRVAYLDGSAFCDPNGGGGNGGGGNQGDPPKEHLSTETARRKTKIYAKSHYERAERVQIVRCNRQGSDEVVCNFSVYLENDSVCRGAKLRVFMRNGVVESRYVQGSAACVNNGPKPPPGGLVKWMAGYAQEVVDESDGTMTSSSVKSCETTRKDEQSASCEVWFGLSDGDTAIIIFRFVETSPNNWEMQPLRDEDITIISPPTAREISPRAQAATLQLKALALDGTTAVLSPAG